jgi:hypothetical protein
MTDPTSFGLARTPENKETIETLQAVKDIGTANPRVAREILKILAEDEKQPAAQQTAPAQESQAAAKSPRAARRPRVQRARRLTRLELHQTHCSICGYDIQEQLEQAFLNWEHLGQITQDFGVDRRTIYRHAHTTGLFEKRDRNVRTALRHIIQKSAGVDTTADSVIRAIKTFAHMNARSEWVNPPTHVIVSQATPRKSSARPGRLRKRSVTARNPLKRLKR